MPRFPENNGDNNGWGTLLRNFFSPFFNLTTGAFVASSISHTELADKGTNTHTQIDTAVSNSALHIADTNDPHNTTWAQVDKTISSIADITTKSHTALTDIGTNTHAQIDTHVGSTSNPHSVTHSQLSDKGTNAHSAIDTFISSKAAASGLASLNGSSLVVQDPANATSTPTASKIPIADGSGDLDNGWINLASGSASLGAAYTITADTTWENSGLSVTLPSIGTYLVIAKASATATVSATVAHISIRLYNSTAESAIDGSEILLTRAVTTGAGYRGSGTSFSIVTTASINNVVRVEAYRSAATWTTSILYQGADSTPSLAYVRIA